MEEIDKSKKNKQGKHNKVTISDVAKLAGVVPSTVSHVINGTAPISEETQERVLNVIKELNYSPNALARALRQRKSGIIGVVLQDISSEFYARCAASILEAARKDNYIVLLCDASFNNDIVRAGVNALIERRVDGFIFIGGGDDEDIIKSVCNANVPIVLGDRHLEGIPSVEFDNVLSMKNLVCALYESGYRRFAYVGEPISIQDNLAARYQGFSEGLKICQIQPKDTTIIFDETLHRFKLKASFDFFNQYLEGIITENRPEVILTSNDMIAHGLISAAKKKGLKVPEDIAVVGFDDITISKYFEPALTTINQDEKLLGKTCYQLFKSVILEGKKSENIFLPQTIMIRESALIPEEILKVYK